MDYRFLLDLAIILLATKLLGLLMKKLGLPQVVGALIAGILIGPAIWSPLTGGRFVPVGESQFLTFLAELGVIMLMFGAGLETDLKELKRSGLKASFVALLGVVVPLVLGFGIAVPFFGLGDTHNVLKCVFIGVIITATSVSITVETLRELGKLKGRVGTVVLSAAIIDDVIGIIVLTFVIGMKNPGQTKPYMVLVKTALFFIIGIGVGVGLNYLFRWLEKKYPHRRRVPIFGLVVCFIYAFCAEHFFGIADITGAYLAGILLSNTKETDYIERKVDVNTYMIFAPVFFANIGIKTSFSDFEPQILLFCALFVLAGMAGKILGCGFAAKACRYTWRESFQVGVGMMARGEVALIVAQKGIAAGLLDEIYVAPVIMLVIVSSLVTPIVLKFMFKKESGLPLVPPDGNITAIENADYSVALQSSADGAANNENAATEAAATELLDSAFDSASIADLPIEKTE
ncbi:cation:proton antiporter [Pumilibacter muris]|uniref:cation:proton antiporter n=1 Tax=Pumilibacter muris TaxID=2941510 RepID=UPI00203DC0AF|nr:cation:proton antiporter [Pumilibacter muris]